MCVPLLQGRFSFPVHPYGVAEQHPSLPKCCGACLDAHSQLKGQVRREHRQHLPREIQELQQYSLYTLKNTISSREPVRLQSAAILTAFATLRSIHQCCLFERGTLLLLYQSLADIACSYEQMLCGCKLEH